MLEFVNLWLYMSYVECEDDEIISIGCGSDNVR